MLINFQTFFSLWALKVSFQNLFLMCKYIILKLAHSWHVLICLCRLVFFKYIIHLELIWSLIIFFIRGFFFQNFNVSFTQYHIIRFLTWELHIIILNIFYDISKVFYFDIIWCMIDLKKFSNFSYKKNAFLRQAIFLLINIKKCQCLIIPSVKTVTYCKYRFISRL